MDGIIGITYRCNSRCVMCQTWHHPSKREEEIRPEDLATLPEMTRLNITGGEPFLRDDIDEILCRAKKKARRVVISTNGFLTEKTLKILAKHKEVGVRISIDGIEETHDEIRGVKRAYRRSLDTLKGLKDLGIRDLGIAVTISDRNAGELVPLYQLACAHRVELATAILHNAYYFHKRDNAIRDLSAVESGIRGLQREYLCSSHPKDWFRAYFTQGIIGHMYGRARSLKCTMATDSFYLDPFGDVRPCNVMDFPFGNIREKPFSEIWTNSRAAEARRRVNACRENCWMIGSVGHLIRHKIWTPLIWIARNKMRTGVKNKT